MWGNVGKPYFSTFFGDKLLQNAQKKENESICHILICVLCYMSKNLKPGKEEISLWKEE